MNVARASLFLLALLNAFEATSEDWPMYQKDASRSGYTAEKLPENLKPLWSFKLRLRPMPAWPQSKR